MAIRYFMIPYFMIHHEIPYGHTVFHGIMKYRMAIRYFIPYVNHEIWYHEIPYGHTVFYDSVWPYGISWNHEIWYHEISYGHTVFYDSMKYRMAIRYFMES